MCFDNRAIATAFLTLFLSASCTVKESRRGCPCLLRLFFADTVTRRMHLFVVGEGFSYAAEVASDTALSLSVPRTGVQVVASTGAALLPGEGLRIPEGYGCPPLRACCAWVDTDAETVALHPVLRKAHCKLSLAFEGPQGWGTPYWCMVRGGVAGFSPEGVPVEGAFSCRLDNGGWVFLPRQQEQLPLWLDIALPDQVVRTFPLGRYMLEAGYDWNREDLEDMPLLIRLSVSRLSLLLPSGEEVVFPVEI